MNIDVLILGKTNLESEIFENVPKISKELILFMGD